MPYENYNKMFIHPDEDVAEKMVDQTVDAVPEVEPPVEPKTGVVTDCSTLNVRKEPSLDAEVAVEISCGATVMIDEDVSTDEFYKVYTEAGIEGFCMKRYISVNR